MINKYRLNNVVNKPFNLSAENENLNKGYYLNGLLSGGLQTSINTINDYEVVDFKFTQPRLRYNINFFLNIPETDDSILNKVNDNTYPNYINELILELKKEQAKYGLDFNNNAQITTTTDHSSKHKPNTLEEFNYSPIDYVKNSKPVSDKLNLLNTVKPQFDGYPSFYKTFSYPYIFNLNAWKDKRFKYANESYLYNSFIKFDFYDSPQITNQNLVFSQTLHVNPRYTNSIKLMDTPFSDYDLPIPEFNIEDGVETYTINWINNFYINQFYVRISFWDALNGNTINLLPTSNFSEEKQWIQNPESFNFKNLFLKYEFNNNKKVYTIFEYNPSTDQWDLITNRFELFQLVFDKYWSNKKPKIIVDNTPNIIKEFDKKADIEISQYNINEIIEEPNFNNRVYNKKITIKNTGNLNLKLDDIVIKYNGTDERIVTDSVTTNNFNEVAFYQRNHYSFIQNQEDYMYFDPPELRVDYGNDFPITINKANQQTYQNKYSEEFNVKYNKDINQSLNVNEVCDIDLRFELNELFYSAYIGKPITDIQLPSFNIPFQNEIGVEVNTNFGDYLVFYDISTGDLTGDKGEYKHIYDYTITFIFIDSDGNKVSKSLGVKIDYTVKR